MTTEERVAAARECGYLLELGSTCSNASKKYSAAFVHEDDADDNDCSGVICWFEWHDHRLYHSDTIDDVIEQAYEGEFGITDAEVNEYLDNYLPKA